MAIAINLQNVEQLVFFNNELKKKLMDSHGTRFHIWGLSQFNPELRAMGQKMLIEFLQSVDDNHIKVLSDHFGQEVTIERINLNVVSNHEMHIDEAESFLNSHTILKEGWVAYREGDQLYLSFWR